MIRFSKLQWTRVRGLALIEDVQDDSLQNDGIDVIDRIFNIRYNSCHINRSQENILWSKK